MVGGGGEQLEMSCGAQGSLLWSSPGKGPGVSPGGVGAKEVGGAQRALRCLLVPGTPHTASDPGQRSGHREATSRLPGRRSSQPEGFGLCGTARSRKLCPTVKDTGCCGGRARLGQGELGRGWTQTWQLQERFKGRERTGLGGRPRMGPPQFWLGGELFTRWGLPKGQLFAFLEPEA